MASILFVIARGLLLNLLPVRKHSVELNLVLRRGDDRNRSTLACCYLLLCRYSLSRYENFTEFAQTLFLGSHANHPSKYVLSLISLLTSTTFSQSRWARPFKQIGHTHDVEDVDETEDNRATVRRLIEENAEEYRDEPNGESSTRAIDAPNGEDGHGPRVQPSQLADGGHEWRT